MAKTILTNVCSYPHSPRTRNRFNQVVEVKGLMVCSYVEKCAEFKNQTLEKNGLVLKSADVCNVSKKR